MINITKYARDAGRVVRCAGRIDLEGGKHMLAKQLSQQMCKKYGTLGADAFRLTRKCMYAYRSQQKFIDFRKDYYQILGVSQDASLQQIKQKFYLLAKEYHPDRNKGADGKFKQINEAYNVLSQTHLRKDYDSNRDRSEEEEDDTTLKDEKAGKSSLNYGAYSQMSKAEWARYRSGVMRHSPVDYSNFQKRYSLEADNDMQLKKKKQWNDAFRSLTVEQVKEEIEFRQKLYKKYMEDMQALAKARQDHVQQKLNQIGDKIQRMLGKTVRGLYDRMIKK